MANCTFIDQNGAHNGAWVNAKTWNYAGSAVGYYYTAMITFKTPALTCKSNNVTFNIAMAQLNGSALTLRYAICSSDVNKAKYCNVYGAVSDTYQLATGTVNISGLGTTVSYHKISVDTTALSGNTTYYLFLWSNSSRDVNPCGTVIQPQGEYINASSNVNHTITITDGHNYTSKVTSPTCTTQGYTTYTCSKCGHSYTGNTTAALGHASVNGGTAAVHTKCSRCGVTLSSTHSYTQSVQTAATCTEKGTTKYTCACGYSYTSQNIAALGHDYKGTIVAPTCTAQGYTTYKCSRCNDTSKANDTFKEALGHDYVGEVTTEPTYTADGVMTYTCSRCKDSYTEAIPKKEGGLVYIDDGTTFVAYQVYIDNGTSWDLYIPYIDNGSDWNICC